jgi:hypothetical protein
MSTIAIYGMTGVTLPYDIYVCDVYGNNCVLVSTINSPIPPIITITLPSQFNTAPAIGLQIIDSAGCEKFAVLNCEVGKGKLFESGEVFLFQDSNIYIFEDQ